MHKFHSLKLQIVVIIIIIIVIIFTIIKVKSRYFFSKATRYEDIYGSGGIVLPLLTSAMDGGEGSSSSSDRFIPGKRTPIPVG
jgi:hypothetical protein